MLRLGPWLRVSPEQLDRADHWFDRYGPWMVLFGRLVPGARSIVSVPAGMSEMPLVRFASLTLVGSLGWNAVLIGVGQSLGANWPAVSGLIDSASTLVLVVVALGGAALVVRLARRRTLPADRGPSSVRLSPSLSAHASPPSPQATVPDRETSR